MSFLQSANNHLAVLKYCTPQAILSIIDKEISSRAKALEIYRVQLFGVALTFFPVFGLIWKYIYVQPYENITLRLLLIIPFGINALPRNLLPNIIKKNQNYLAVGSLMLALPIFFTFMWLQNNCNQVWTLSLIVSFMVTPLLFGSFTVMLGVFFSIVINSIYIFITMSFSEIIFIITNLSSQQISNIIIILFAISVTVFLNITTEFTNRRELAAMIGTAASVAHELRTPLMSIRLAATGTKHHINDLIHAYRLASEGGLPVRKIRERHLDSIAEVYNSIDKEINYTNAIIDILLMDSTKTGDSKTLLSMSDCVKESLARYPFTEKQKQYVKVNEINDFEFLGNSVNINHVFFNLIKNSMRFIKTDITPEIVITYGQKEKNYHIMSLRDNGRGINKTDLPHIFERFFTTANGAGILGNGIGLAFCNDIITSIGGTITCESVYGEYTLFKVKVPVYHHQKEHKLEVDNQ